MRRRDVITLLGVAAATPWLWPRSARAQQPAMPVIGYLGSRSFDVDAHLVAAFHKGLKQLGYVDGHTVGIEYRWADGQYDRLSAFAADLVRRRVNLLVAATNPAALAAKAATSTMPIVFLGGGDPVQLGLVSSVNRPGGNLTGVNVVASELGAKWVGMLHELVPSARAIASLINPTNPNAGMQSTDAQAAARSLGLQISILRASTDRDIEGAFATLVQQRVGGLGIPSDPFLISRRDQLVAFAARHSVPAIYSRRDYTAAGGLMSYGNSIEDQYREAGVYSGKVLSGTKPADLPVQFVTRFELVINLKTAKALNLEIPPTLLARADEVIE
jgi:putative ABC transport system substrate-binding protein